MFGVRILDRGALRIGSASALEDEVSGALTRLQRTPPPPAATNPSARHTDRTVMAQRRSG